MSFEFIPKKDFHLEKGKTYYLFENGDILIPKKKAENNLIECEKL
ncbi:MAG: hypothetical protein ACFFDN_02715 [Candidatus Hodarchaeota archaeon]